MHHSDTKARRGGTILDDVSDIGRTVVKARLEAVAGVVEAAETFIDTLVQNEPLSESRSYATAMRRAPGVVAAAVSNARDRVREIPRKVGAVAAREPDARRGRPRHTSSLFAAQQRVIDAARDLLMSLPSGQASLVSVVDEIALETGYQREIVRDVMLRHFVVHGDTISVGPDQDLDIAEEVAVPVNVAQFASEHGYEVSAVASDSAEPSAVLLLVNDKAASILVYVVAVGDVNDVSLREGARADALAIEDATKPSQVWVTDGSQDYFLDLESNQAVDSLRSRAEKRARTKPTPTDARE